MKNNKSILHIVNTFYAVTYFIGDQFLYFKDKGYDLHVICSPSDRMESYSKSKGFKYEDIPLLRSISITQDIKSLIQICRYIKKNNIGIIVGHTPKGGLLAMIAGKLMRVPKRIYFRHGLVYETSSGFIRQLLIFAEKLTSCCATKIICVSPSLMKRSVEDRLNPEYKQLILGEGTCGGIDSEEKFNPHKINTDKLNALRQSLNITKNDIVIGYCGRLVKDKGIKKLVETLNILPENYKLLLVGDFEERDALKNDLQEEITQNNKIIKTGFIFNDIEYYYALMSVFILPSYREGFPTSTLEASSMQIPVLTTKVTGCIDAIIDGETGYYISHDPQDIKAKIIKLQDKELRDKLGYNGRKFVLNNFDNRILWPIIEKELYI